MKEDHSKNCQCLTSLASSRPDYGSLGDLFVLNNMRLKIHRGIMTKSYFQISGCDVKFSRLGLNGKWLNYCSSCCIFSVFVSICALSTCIQLCRWTNICLNFHWQEVFTFSLWSQIPSNNNLNLCHLLFLLKLV